MSSGTPGRRYLLAPEADDALAARFFALAQGAFAALSVHHAHGAHPGAKRTGPDHALATRCVAHPRGEETVQTACASGVPFAGIGMQMEQKLNIEECVDFGNALAFTMHDIRRHRIPSLVERLLTDATLRRRARELAALTQGIDGAQRSAEVILRFLDDRR